jgi:hypothetical protein
MNHPNLNEIFTHIKFNPANHTYRCNGQSLTNVTKFIKQYQQPFDADYWAARKAEERGCTPAEIKAEWDAKRQAGQEKGTKIHQHIAQTLTGQLAPADPFLALNDRLPEMNAFDQFWQTIQATLQPLKIEWVVGDTSLGIAGTADALFYSTKTGQYHLWDWKTGGKFKTNNPFQNLLAPFDELPDCELNTYSLQTSLYRLIIERNTGLTLGDSYILYLSNGFEVHKALDLKEQLETLLKRP